jgi:hypothetical protein
MLSNKNLETIFLIFIIALGFLNIYLAFGTKLLGEDETYYYSMAKNLSKGTFTVRDMFGGPQPSIFLTSMLCSFFFQIISPSLGMLKAISAFFGLLTLLVVYIIGKKFNIYCGIFSAFLLFSIQTFSQFMMIAYVEIPIAFFSIFLIYLFLNMKNTKNAIFTGLILGLAYYAKASALVLDVILLFYALFLLFSTKDKKYFKLMFITLVVSGLILIPLAIRNILLFKYPYIEGLNLFFKIPSGYEWPKWLSELKKTVSPVRPSLQAYTSTFGWLAFILGIFGIAWLFSNWKINKENSFLLLQLVSFLTFMFIFNLFYLISFSPLEPRYLSIIFPQLSLLGGFFLWKMKEWNKWLLILIIPILFFSLFSGITTSIGTYNSQRYPDDYIEALKWIKVNTPKDALIFTAYSGSLKYFGERDNIWATNVNEYFPQLMTTTNSTFIYDILKQYNVSYILIWRSIMAQNYIIPESNLWGIFTYNFANVVSADTEHFDLKFSNENNWIFELKQLNQTNQSK